MSIVILYLKYNLTGNYVCISRDGFVHSRIPSSRFLRRNANIYVISTTIPERNSYVSVFCCLSKTSFKCIKCQDAIKTKFFNVTYSFNMS